MADTTAAVVLAMSALGIFILVVGRQWQRLKSDPKRPSSRLPSNDCVCP